MIPIRPGGAVVVEDAVDWIVLIERQVVKAQVAVDQGPIGCIHRHALVFFDNICERADQTAVVDDARQAFANPGTGLWPRHVLPQPAGGVRLDNPGVLLHEDLPNRA